VHFVVAPVGEEPLFYELFLLVDFGFDTCEYFLFISANYAFFSFAYFNSSSLLSILVCDVYDFTLFTDDPLEILLIPDLESSNFPDLA
jgi:hypothetical protein